MKLLSPVAAPVVIACTAMAQPNFVVIQPDDFPFYEEMTPPAHNQIGLEYMYPNYTDYPLPNLEYLRTRGLEMQQAYTASAMCGTSRYSTITGRYPSRSSTSRKRQRNIRPGLVPEINIPRTKLDDVTLGRGIGNSRNRIPDLEDCSRFNLAALLQQNGYRTGVTGKWHLKRTNGNSWDYERFAEEVAECGFDMAKGLYAENLGGFWTDFGAFSHNMEYITDYALQFIHGTSSSSEPFFLYFNPTVPHGSGSVYEALVDYSCLDTPEGDSYDTEPIIPGMTAEHGNCSAYRQTVLDRAQAVGAPTDRNVLGAIWLDDALGAILQALNATDQLDNTFILFQLDHGQEGKGTLWESGIRIAQFIHYPDGNFAEGQQFPGLVSTIDIAPTILDYANITASNAIDGSWFEMDGKSWKDAVGENDTESELTQWFRDERCLFFELDRDRAVRCGCDKFLLMDPNDSTSLDRSLRYFGQVSEPDALMDLCGSNHSGLSVPSPEPNIEALRLDDAVRQSQLESLVESHLAKTHPALQDMDFTELVDPAI